MVQAFCSSGGRAGLERLIQFLSNQQHMRDYNDLCSLGFSLSDLIEGWNIRSHGGYNAVELGIEA